MHIHHVAIWAQDLEALKAFYCTLFGGQANERYHNPSKQFSSCFVRFEGRQPGTDAPHPVSGGSAPATPVAGAGPRLLPRQRGGGGQMTARLKLLKGAEVKHLDGPAGPATAITKVPSSTRRATGWS